MPIYISRGRFTSDAVKGMLANPENREEAVAKLFKSVGGRLIGWYLTFGHHDWLAIGEFPDEKAAASAVLAAAAGGSLSDVETTVAMTAKMLQLLSSLLERQQGSSGAPGARRFGARFRTSAFIGKRYRCQALAGTCQIVIEDRGTGS